MYIKKKIKKCFNNIFLLACLTLLSISFTAGKKNTNRRDTSGKKEIKVNSFSVTPRYDLGKWNTKALDLLITRGAVNYSDANQRIMYYVYNFMFTPFEYEEKGRVKPLQNEVLVKLSAFDCITFIYFLTALTVSNNFGSLASNVARIRYMNPEYRGIHTDHDKGNLFDFAFNSLVINCTDMRQIFYNLTEDLLASHNLNPYYSEMTLKRRKAEKSVGNHITHPKYSVNGKSQKESMNFIYPDDIDLIKKDLKSGDIVLFARRKRTSEEIKKGQADVLIGHCGVIVKGADIPLDAVKLSTVYIKKNEVYFIHASAYNNRNGKKTGLDFAGMYHKKIPFGYSQHDSRIPRPLKHYVKGIGFVGVAFLRPQNIW